MKKKIANGLNLATALLLASVLFACQPQQEEGEGAAGDTTAIATAEREVTAEQLTLQIYKASIGSLNTDANGGRFVEGEVMLKIDGDFLNIRVDVSGLEPNSMHLQHLHGAKVGNQVSCPTMEADQNNDGVIDVTEAAATAGITMIPFHDSPASLQIKTDTYPQADKNGNLHYQQTVNLAELKQAWSQEFGREDFDLGQFTYMIHGISSDYQLPASVQSVLEVPAHATLPVGCGKVQRQERAATY